MKRPAFVFVILAGLTVAALFGACSAPSPIPTPEPLPTSLPAPTPPSPNHQGAQAFLSISVPASGASTWVRSTLVRVTSLGLVGSDAGVPGAADAVVLYGANDDTVAVTSGSSLGAFSGATGPQNVGQVGFNAGGYEYFAVNRIGGSTSGLTFVIVGDDGAAVVDGGSISIVLDGGTVTANQGAPNAGGALAWPVTDPVVESNTETTNALLTTTNELLALITPAGSAATITPNDGANLPSNCKAVSVGSAGNITVDFVTNGTGVTLFSVQPGVWPYQIKKVYATGTTATSLTCLF